MDTLNHANPFFVRCIKSNAEKVLLCHFLELCNLTVTNGPTWILLQVAAGVMLLVIHS